jgi:hypothetical protein
LAALTLFIQPSDESKPSRLLGGRAAPTARSGSNSMAGKLVV